MNVSFHHELCADADTLVFPLFEGQEAYGSLLALDQQIGGLISHQLKSSKTFKGKVGQILLVHLPEVAGHRQLLLIGLGKEDSVSMDDVEKTGGKLSKALKAAGAEKVCTQFSQDFPNTDFGKENIAAHLALGAKLATYDFDKYKDKRDQKEAAPKVSEFHVMIHEASETEAVFSALSAIADGVFFARDLVNEPPNILYPASFAEFVKDKLKPLGVQIEILDEKKMIKMGMGSLTAVGQGSEKDSQMVIMRWNGGKASDKPLGFVGKGVTFDTGGISIKPSGQMDLMKMDMGGAAAVCGLLYSLALRKAPVNVVGAIGLVENMPSHNAYRPADVITAYNGKTIEVLNTDAEGRLVLCDTLSYVQEQYDPEFVIDLATLTGAIMVGLGTEYFGVFCNNDDLWSKIESSGKNSGEKPWRMPLGENFSEEMKSKIADYRNLGTVARYGGASTAAAFLEFFVDKDRPWAHMDIAGTAWTGKDQDLCPAGGTGSGVRVLNKIIEDHYM